MPIQLTVENINHLPCDCHELWPTLTLLLLYSFAVITDSCLQHFYLKDRHGSAYMNDFVLFCFNIALKMCPDYTKVLGLHIMLKAVLNPCFNNWFVIGQDNCGLLCALDWGTVKIRWHTVNRTKCLYDWLCDLVSFPYNSTAYHCDLHANQQLLLCTVQYCTF